MMLNLVLFGPPGAGKGTQSQKLIDQYQLVHISTGDLFRAHISGQTELGQRVSTLIADGELVPDSIALALAEREIDQKAQARGFLLVGLSRRVARAEAVDRFLESKGSGITGVNAREVTEAELTARIAQRKAIS